MIGDGKSQRHKMDLDFQSKSKYGHTGWKDSTCNVRNVSVLLPGQLFGALFSFLHHRSVRFALALFDCLYCSLLYALHKAR